MFETIFQLLFHVPSTIIFFLIIEKPPVIQYILMITCSEVKYYYILFFLSVAGVLGRIHWDHQPSIGLVGISHIFFFI